ncbi:MAG: PRC-barrel domain-containing protein [Candidatus Micrarchaeaceae archaeon]|jgi:sporulation protein YlmC with PRC-barrel domain
MTDMLLSELYGREIISNTGRRIGTVEDIIVDFEKGCISSMLLVKSEELIRSDHTSLEFAKNSVRYERVKSVDETVIVSGDTAVK